MCIAGRVRGAPELLDRREPLRLTLTRHRSHNPADCNRDRQAMYVWSRGQGRGAPGLWDRREPLTALALLTVGEIGRLCMCVHKLCTCEAGRVQGASELWDRHWGVGESKVGGHRKYFEVQRVGRWKKKLASTEWITHYFCSQRVGEWEWAAKIFSRKRRLTPSPLVINIDRSLGKLWMCEANAHSGLTQHWSLL